MLDFERLTLANASGLKPLFTHTYSRLCDYVFGTLLMWRDMWPTDIAAYEDMLFIRIEVSAGRHAYMLPIAGDLVHAIGVLDSHYPGEKLFYNIPKEGVEILKRRFSNADVVSIDSGGDYIYEAASMATLSGRKLGGQRNHRNYFERTWKYHFEEITSVNMNDVKAFIERKPIPGSSALFAEGNKKTLEVLDNLDIYNFSTLALYAEDHVIGFTFGTLLEDTLNVTVEQADRDYRGVYPKLTSEFVSKHIDKGALFVNREDDLGNEGLRRAKLAWNPCEIVERLSVSVDG